jgi:hypothetical protein
VIAKNRGHDSNQLKKVSSYFAILLLHDQGFQNGGQAEKARAEGIQNQAGNLGAAPAVSQAGLEIDPS